MNAIGGECVAAAEINEACVQTYKANFPDTPIFGDISLKHTHDAIPEFDLLCAGFPCQPFSKAGKRLGFKDESRGKLFFSILQILDKHKEAKGFIFENVKNLADNKNFWETICTELKKRNFIITEEPLILSPSDFNIPQKRQRVFILGIKQKHCNKKLHPYSKIKEEDLNLSKIQCSGNSAFSILDNEVNESFIIPQDKEEALFAWDEFRDGTKIKTIGFPIWLSHFGIGINKDSEVFEKLEIESMPVWKQKYLKNNRHFYQMHRKFIDIWVEKYHMLSRNKLLQKFEWNCGVDVANMKGGLIQIRQSGVRVKRPNLFPTLVAMQNTPIIWDKKLNHFRWITPREAAKLQSFAGNFKFTGTNNQAYKQLGNAVNVEIAKQLGKGLLNLINQEN
jgi:DNA (cytosine-5)-methyltransferase 1